MKKESFNTDVVFTNEKIQTKVILETSFSKEIRILLAKGQFMKNHKAPFPIIVHILEGEIEFRVNNESYLMKTGDVITLDAHVVHNLSAISNAVVRLSLSKSDSLDRVKSVVD